MWIIVGSIFVIVLSAGIAVAIAELSPRRAKRGAVPSGDRAQQANAPGNGDQAAALEGSQLVIHALLQDLTDNVESLLDSSSAYGDSLEGHRASLGKAMTIAGIKQIEQMMMTELEGMQTANAQYQRQLDQADAKLKEQQEELEKAQSEAGVDFLTHIPNRRQFDERLAEEFDRAKRHGGTFSLIIFDVDHFKRVNDTHGHLAGDRVLRGVAQLLDVDRRSSDFLARYGGEEFTLILPETHADKAMALADKLRTKIERAKFRYQTESLRLTISAGVDEVDAQEDSAEAFFARVDAALYRAKENGRNRVEAGRPAE